METEERLAEGAQAQAAERDRPLIFYLKSPKSEHWPHDESSEIGAQLRPQDAAKPASSLFPMKRLRKRSSLLQPRTQPVQKVPANTFALASVGPSQGASWRETWEPDESSSPSADQVTPESPRSARTTETQLQGGGCAWSTCDSPSPLPPSFLPPTPLYPVLSQR